MLLLDALRDELGLDASRSSSAGSASADRRSRFYLTRAWDLFKPRARANADLRQRPAAQGPASIMLTVPGSGTGAASVRYAWPESKPELSN